jgi:ornithine cyclodeaminase/alanine dehydrogenase-like protein (mu-crystallin family)
MRVLDDAAVMATITPELAVSAARDAILAAHRGELVGPPRTVVPAGDTSLTFTVGGELGGAAGFRVYGRWPGASDQLVAVWGPDGRIRGLVVGDALGPLRTGALGAVALDLLAPHPLPVLTVIGTGRQAWTQLWAATAVRTPGRVLVHSRDPDKREAFAARARAELDLDARAAAGVQEAVEAAHSVILATTSTTPVLQPGWLAAATSVSTVGPKVTGYSELPLELLDTAGVVASDSPGQLEALGHPYTGLKVAHLGALIAGEVAPKSHGLRIFCSAGLAGSEVVLADRLLAASS